MCVARPARRGEARRAASRLGLPAARSSARAPPKPPTAEAARAGRERLSHSDSRPRGAAVQVAPARCAWLSPWMRQGTAPALSQVEGSAVLSEGEQQSGEQGGALGHPPDDDELAGRVRAGADAAQPLARGRAPPRGGGAGRGTHTPKTHP